MNWQLCYIDPDDGCAYFTTDLAAEWGDDWNDRPYEHNAGTPYGKHGLLRVWFAALHWDVQQPHEPHFNSPWSVQDINRGACPWLRAPDGNLHAGASLDDMRRYCEAHNGSVFRPMRYTPADGEPCWVEDAP